MPMCKAQSVKNQRPCGNKAVMDLDADGVADSCDVPSHIEQVRKALGNAKAGDSDAGARSQGDAAPAPSLADLPVHAGPESEAVALAPETSHFVRAEITSTDSPATERTDPLDKMAADLFTKGRPIEQDVAAAERQASEQQTQKTQQPVPQLVLRDGPWSAEQVEKMLPMMDPLLVRVFGEGEELTDAEIASGGEPWAAFLNYYAAKIDPNSPSGAVSLWCVIVLGPRAFSRVFKGRKAAPAGPAASTAANKTENANGTEPMRATQPQSAWSRIK